MTSKYARFFAPVEPEQIVGVLADLRRASLTIRRLEAYFRENDFSLLRFLILIIIDREPEKEALQFSEIVEKVDVSKPVVTRTIKSLLEDDLLMLRCEGSDKRMKMYALSKEGRSRLESLFPGYFKLLGDAAEGESS